MALIDKASLLMVPSTYEAGTLYNVLPSGNRAPDSTDQNSGYDQTRADFDFDRGSNAAATRVNASGLIEKYRENLLVQSNAFSTSPWNTNLVTATSGQSGYDGNTNAWKIDLTGATGNLAVGGLSVGNVGTYSVYAKAGTLNWILLGSQSGNIQAYINLSDGSIGTTGVLVIEAKTEDVGGGWYRCSMTYSGTATVARVYPAQANGDLTATSGNIYIQNAQLESGLVATDYLESTSVTGKAGVLVDLPRINYDANGENGSLLLEPSRANLIPFSEFFDPWNTDAGEVKTANTIQSPEGLVNGNTLRQNNGASQLNVYKLLSVTSGADYIFSVWLKKKSTNQVQIYQYSTQTPVGFVSRATIDFDAETITDVDGTGATIEPYKNGWFRCSIKCTTPSTSLSNGIYTPTAGQADVYVYGAQVEAGSYATSYIPTMGTSETRAADSCSVTGASDVIGQTEGTLFIEAENNPSAYLFAAPNNVIFGSINSGNYLNNFHFTTDASKIYVYCNSGGTLYASPGTTLPSSSILKMAVTYTSSAIKFFLNGVLVGTDTSFNLPVGMNQIDVGHMGGQPATQKMRGGIDKFIVFTEAITDAEAITLTTL